jgi:hypothetical protein
MSRIEMIRGCLTLFSWLFPSLKGELVRFLIPILCSDLWPQNLSPPLFDPTTVSTPARHKVSPKRVKMVRIKRPLMVPSYSKWSDLADWAPLLLEVLILFSPHPVPHRMHITSLTLRR